MIIYKIENKTNQKIYIGQTKQKLNRRLSDHIMKSRKSGKKTVFHSALMKYGIGGFDISIIDTATSSEELNIKEVYWIRYYNCVYPNGYNLDEGGKSRSWNKESRNRLSLSKRSSTLQKRTPVYRFDKNGNFEKCFNSLTEAAEKGIQMPMKGKLENSVFAIKRGNYIYTTKKELFDKYIKKENERSENDILFFDKDKNILGVYKTTLEMERQTKIANTGISMVARGKQKVFNNGSFVLYRKDATIENINSRANYVRPKLAKKIKMFNESEEFVFENSSKAALETGLNRQLIAIACKKNKLYKNYYWQYI